MDKYQDAGWKIILSTCTFILIPFALFGTIQFAEQNSGIFGSAVKIIVLLAVLMGLIVARDQLREGLDEYRKQTKRV